jgi:hypothetical protein
MDGQSGWGLLRGHFYRFVEQCQPVIAQHTVCIYVWEEKSNSLKVLGTGVLLRVASKQFLLSAAHVLDHGFIHRMPLVAQPSRDPEGAIGLKFVGCRSSIPPTGMRLNDPDLRDDDPLDFGIAELTPETADKLTSRHRFLTLSDLDESPPSETDGLFVVFGYPQALASPGTGDVQIENWPLPYMTFPFRGQPETRDHNKDILMGYYRQGSDGFGATVEVPRPHGLSGCGIWRVAKKPIDPGDLSVEDIRFVGIQHRWRPDSNYIVGTSIRHVRPMLLGAYPDLRPALEMWRPR